MAVVFAVIVPQIRNIRTGWDSKEGIAEALQNGRVLIDHLSRNLAKSVRITAVSGPSEPNGFIEFQDNDSNTLRYDIGVNNYVEFGLVGQLYELAGPVSQLLFTCYDGNDFDNPTTDANSIRFVEVETTLTNAAARGQDKTFTTQTYIRTNYQDDDAGWILSSVSDVEFDIKDGRTPALCQIDGTHYLCAYEGDGSDGWAVVLTVDTGNWSISEETPFEFDDKKGKEPALVKIDDTHYFCAYQGDGDDGWAVVLTVDTGNWSTTGETPFEFDDKDGRTPALYQINSTHYLCAYEGDGSDGWANILKVDAGNWNISGETPFEFDNKKGNAPALAQIDDNHFLCAYQGDGDDGWAVVLTISKPDLDAISMETPFEFDAKDGRTPALCRIDSTHYLCAYEGDGSDGWATVLTVNAGNWSISEETPFEFDNKKGKMPALVKIDDTHYFCAYQGDGDDGWAVVLTVDTGDWSISGKTPFEFDDSKGEFPALSEIDDTHFLCAYQGDGDDGWAAVLRLGPPVLP
jgi:hypothetical protein